MIADKIKKNISRLQDVNYKSFYLAFLRVAISVWLIKEVCINWSSMEMLYGQSAFIFSKTSASGNLHGILLLIKGHYIGFILIYLFVLLLNILGIGRSFTSLLVFLMLHLLQKMNLAIFNGGDLMAKLLAFYLIFADTYQYFILFKTKPNQKEQNKIKNLLSNLAAISIMAQLCLAYFSSGIGKLSTDFWQQGEATYYAFLNERFMGTPFNQWIAKQKWIDYLSNYFTLIIELLFPFLVWFKKFRNFFLIAGILFHLGIYIFLMIYGFEIVFILIYGLFLPNDLLLKYAHKIQNFFGGKPGLVTRYIGLADGAKKM